MDKARPQTCLTLSPYPDARLAWRTAGLLAHVDLALSSSPPPAAVAVVNNNNSVSTLSNFKKVCAPGDPTAAWAFDRAMKPAGSFTPRHADPLFTAGRRAPRSPRDDRRPHLLRAQTNSRWRANRTVDLPEILSTDLFRTFFGSRMMAELARGGAKPPRSYADHASPEVKPPYRVGEGGVTRRSALPPRPRPMLRKFPRRPDRSPRHGRPRSGASENSFADDGVKTLPTRREITRRGAGLRPWR